LPPPGQGLKRPDSALKNNGKTNFLSIYNKKRQKMKLSESNQTEIKENYKEPSGKDIGSPISYQESKNITINAWPVLTKQEGYWFSGFTSIKSIDKLKQYKGLNIKIDLEPPLPNFNYNNIKIKQKNQKERNGNTPTKIKKN